MRTLKRNHSCGVIPIKRNQQSSSQAESLACETNLAISRRGLRASYLLIFLLFFTDPWRAKPHM
jgi:hypothetical protein